MNKTKQIVFLFLTWRMLLFIPLVAGYLFISYSSGSAYTGIWNFIKPYSPVDSFLLFPWANFDGVHYLSIAANGYAQDGSNARFFPLFPMIAGGLSQLFGLFGNASGEEAFGAVQFFSALLLANLFFLPALAIFYKLVRLDYSHSTAITSILFFLVFPTSFFFAAIYSESLFLLLLLLAFYFARKRQWWLAGIFGILLCITRLVGIAILPALIWEFFRGNVGDKGNSPRFSKILPLAFIPFSLIAFMAFNLAKWGNAFHFFLAQGQLNNERSVTSIVLPIQTVIRYGKILLAIPATQFAFWIALFEVSVFFVVIILLFVAWKKKIRGSYLWYASAAFLVPTLSGTFSGLPRYVLVLFPMFMTLALFENKIIKVIYAAVSVVILFILLMFFSRGYFVA